MNEVNGRKATHIIEKYKETIAPILQLSFPTLSPYEIDMAINASIEKRAKNSKAILYNNYKERKLNSSLIDMTEYILSRKPIITSMGVLFMKHGTVPNPLYHLLQKFIDNRTIHKNEMFKYPKGSEEFQKYNLLQLLDKLDSNALYGALGQYACIYYNLHVASSTTGQGQSCISAAILLFESFLSNNVKFGSLNEIISFIKNVTSEERQFRDYDILDRDITLEETWFKLMSTCGFEYVPSEKDMVIIWDILSRLSQENLNRLFYKNNLYHFMDNSLMNKKLIDILCSLETPFLNPNKPPKEIKEKLEIFYDLLFEYVYYGYQYIDRIERVRVMIRNVSIITDTDSTIVSLDAWYRYAREFVKDIPMRVKIFRTNAFEAIKRDEFGDCDPMRVFLKNQPKYEFNFYLDKMEEKKEIPRVFIPTPEKDLKYSIINIMAYCVGKLSIDYMERYTKNSNSYSPDREECLLVLKNEFYFPNVLVTNGKKNYATLQALQEGNIVPDNKMLDIKGLPMFKNTTPEETQIALKQILNDEILRTDEPNQIEVIKKLCILEQTIRETIMKGSKDYFKPARIKAYKSYDNPMSTSEIKAAVVYNEVKSDNAEAFDLTVRNAIHVIKVNINIKNVDSIRDVYPENYNKIKKLFEALPALKNQITSIALPINEPVPDWLKGFIDYATIINDNIKNFPIEEIGLYRMEKSTVNVSNIIHI